MNDDKKHTQRLRFSDIAIYTVFFFVVFFIAWVLLINVAFRCSSLGDLLFRPMTPFVLLAFDILWLIVVKFWLKRDFHTKLVCTLLVLTLSASVFACWLYWFLLRDFHY